MRRLLPDLFACATIVLVAVALLSPLHDAESWPQTHDNNYRYFWLVEHFEAALDHGILYPRWIPEAMGGYGSPVFVFYQPGFFYLGALFAELVDHPLLSMWAVLLFLMAQGGLGAYCIARRFGEPAAALLVALLFLATPYLYVNLHVRGALAEYAAILLTPWPLVGLLAVARTERVTLARTLVLVVATAAALAAIVVTHPAIGLFTFPAFALLALGLAWRTGREEESLDTVVVVSACTSLALAVCLSAPYWATFLYMRQYVTFDALHHGIFVASDHLVHPAQFVERAWGHAGSRAGPDDGTSFQLGAVHLAVAVAGAWLGRSIPVFRLAALAYAGLLLLMTPAAAPVWDALPIQKIQFPWRLLGVTAILQTVLACGLLRARRGVALPVLAAAVLLAAVFSPGQFSPHPVRRQDAAELVRAHRETYRDVFHSYSFPTEDALLARTAADLREAGPRGDTPVVTVPGRTARPASDHSPFVLHYELGEGPPARATIHQVYLPGWTVELDGRPVGREVLEENLTRFGTMQVPLAAETRDLRAGYRGPPRSRAVATLAVAGIVLSLTGFVVFLRLRGRGGDA